MEGLTITPCCLAQTQSHRCLHHTCDRHPLYTQCSDKSPHEGFKTCLPSSRSKVAHATTQGRMSSGEASIALDSIPQRATRVPRRPCLNGLEGTSGHTGGTTMRHCSPTAPAKSKLGRSTVHGDQFPIGVLDASPRVLSAQGANMLAEGHASASARMLPRPTSTTRWLMTNER